MLVENFNKKLRDLNSKLDEVKETKSFNSYALNHMKQTIQDMEGDIEEAKKIAALESKLKAIKQNMEVLNKAYGKK